MCLLDWSKIVHVHIKANIHQPPPTQILCTLSTTMYMHLCITSYTQGYMAILYTYAEVTATECIALKPARFRSHPEYQGPRSMSKVLKEECQIMAGGQNRDVMQRSDSYIGTSNVI